MLRLMRTAEGRRGARELMVLGVEGELMSATARRQGHTYDAEVILLILDRMMQGSGVGARLFDGMEQAFRQARCAAVLPVHQHGLQRGLL